MPDQLNPEAQTSLPELHPTRRKVLAGVAELSQDGSWSTSSAVRKNAGISQQLLNRHLRGLESEGLVSLEKQGPGRPLKVRVTNPGLRALGLSLTLPQPEPAIPPQAPQPTPDPGPLAAQPGKRPVIRLTKRVYLFLERLYIALTPFMRDVERGDYFHAAGPAMNQRPVKPALYEALSPYLMGIGPAEFEQIVTRITLSGAQSGSQVRQRRITRPALADYGPDPLSLNPLEAALEARLVGAMNKAYQGMSWPQRTKLLSDEWDRARRRRLGLFRTMFSSFDPRWQRLDWADFNQARRQADYRGADYALWVAAQFEELSPEGHAEVTPGELYGKRALTAYENYID